MEHGEFEIGHEFWVDRGNRKCGDWRVTDVGTRTITAVKLDFVDLGPSGWGDESYIPFEQAEREGYFKGPPYRVPEICFDERDMADCNPGRRDRSKDERFIYNWETKGFDPLPPPSA